MSRKRRDFKNISLALLLVAAIYQTGTLWLENYSGHNFFYYISSMGKGANAGIVDAGALDAEYITVGYGNKMFDVLYGENGKRIKECADDVIKQTAEKSVIEGSEEIDIASVIEKKAVVFAMPSEVSAADYLSAIGADITGQNVYDYRFDSIVVVPAEEDEAEDEAYLVNSASNTAIVTRGNAENGQELLELIGEAETQYIYDLQYISTAQSGFNIFSGNIFVPQWTQSSFEYTPVMEKAVFDISDENALITQLEPFFGNYHGQSIDVNEFGEFTISDDEVVVKYTAEKILEYYSYRAEDDSVEQNTYSAYEVCKEFLKKDENIGTDYYLTQVQVRNNTIAFFFDYCIDNMPIVLLEEGENGITGKHAIEVVVKNNAVKNYRRYAVNFGKGAEESMAAQNDFLMAVTNTASLMGNGDEFTAIDGMTLGYGLDENGIYTLKWFTEIDGNIFVTDTEGAE